MQVASVCTARLTLRSEIDGWSYEDSSLLVRRQAPGADMWPPYFIGYTPAPKEIPRYFCILEMLADGWVLLGPPTEEKYENKGESDDEVIVTTQWAWWLTRDRAEGAPQ